MRTEANKTDMLSIQLSLDPTTGDYEVDSVDIHQPNFKHRLTFSADKSVQEILSTDLAAYVSGILGRINQETMILSEPDAVIDLPGLVLGKLRVLVHTSASLAQRVIVRFAYFIGGVQAAFRVSTHFALPTISHREALAVAALHDICIPVFDVVSSAVTGIFDNSESRYSTNSRLSRLADVESDLLFYLQLLKRYVASASPEHLAGPEPQPVYALEDHGIGIS